MRVIKADASPSMGPSAMAHCRRSSLCSALRCRADRVLHCTGASLPAADLLRMAQDLDKPPDEDHAQNGAGSAAGAAAQGVPDMHSHHAHHRQVRCTEHLKWDFLRFPHVCREASFRKRGERCTGESCTALWLGLKASCRVERWVAAAALILNPQVRLSWFRRSTQVSMSFYIVSHHAIRRK